MIANRNEIGKKYNTTDIQKITTLKIKSPWEIYSFFSVVNTDAFARFDKQGSGVPGWSGQTDILQMFAEKQFGRAVGESIEGAVDVHSGAYLARAVEKILSLGGG